MQGISSLRSAPSGARVGTGAQDAFSSPPRESTVLGTFHEQRYVQVPLYNSLAACDTIRGSDHMQTRAKRFAATSNDEWAILSQTPAWYQLLALFMACVMVFLGNTPQEKMPYLRDFTHASTTPFYKNQSSDTAGNCTTDKVGGVGVGCLRGEKFTVENSSAVVCNDSCRSQHSSKHWGEVAFGNEQDEEMKTSSQGEKDLGVKNRKDKQKNKKKPKYGENENSFDENKSVINTDTSNVNNSAMKTNKDYGNQCLARPSSVPHSPVVPSLAALISESIRLRDFDLTLSFFFLGAFTAPANSQQEQLPIFSSSRQGVTAGGGSSSASGAGARMCGFSAFGNGPRTKGFRPREPSSVFENFLDQSSISSTDKLLLTLYAGILVLFVGYFLVWKIGINCLCTRLPENVITSVLTQTVVRATRSALKTTSTRIPIRPSPTEEENPLLSLGFKEQPFSGRFDTKIDSFSGINEKSRGGDKFCGPQNRAERNTAPGQGGGECSNALLQLSGSDEAVGQKPDEAAERDSQSPTPLVPQPGAAFNDSFSGIVTNPEQVLFEQDAVVENAAARMLFPLFTLCPAVHPVCIDNVQAETSRVTTTTLTGRAATASATLGGYTVPAVLIRSFLALEVLIQTRTLLHALLYNGVFGYSSGATWQRSDASAPARGRCPFVINSSDVGVVTHEMKEYFYSTFLIKIIGQHIVPYINTRLAQHLLVGATVLHTYFFYHIAPAALLSALYRVVVDVLCIRRRDPRDVDALEPRPRRRLASLRVAWLTFAASRVFVETAAILLVAWNVRGGVSSAATIAAMLLVRAPPKSAASHIFYIRLPLVDPDASCLTPLSAPTRAMYLNLTPLVTCVAWALATTVVLNVWYYGADSAPETHATRGEGPLATLTTRYVYRLFTRHYTVNGQELDFTSPRAIKRGYSDTFPFRVAVLVPFTSAFYITLHTTAVNLVLFSFLFIGFSHAVQLIGVFSAFVVLFMWLPPIIESFSVSGAAIFSASLSLILMVHYLNSGAALPQHGLEKTAIYAALDPFHRFFASAVPGLYYFLCITAASAVLNVVRLARVPAVACPFPRRATRSLKRTTLAHVVVATLLLIRILPAHLGADVAVPWGGGGGEGGHLAATSQWDGGRGVQTLGGHDRAPHTSFFHISKAKSIYSDFAYSLEKKSITYSIFHKTMKTTYMLFQCVPKALYPTSYEWCCARLDVPFDTKHSESNNEQEERMSGDSSVSGARRFKGATSSQNSATGAASLFQFEKDESTPPVLLSFMFLHCVLFCLITAACFFINKYVILPNKERALHARNASVVKGHFSKKKGVARRISELPVFISFETVAARHRCVIVTWSLFVRRFIVAVTVVGGLFVCVYGGYLIGLLLDTVSAATVDVLHIDLTYYWRLLGLSDAEGAAARRLREGAPSVVTWPMLISAVIMIGMIKHFALGTYWMLMKAFKQ